MSIAIFFIIISIMYKLFKLNSKNLKNIICVFLVFIIVFVNEISYAKYILTKNMNIDTIATSFYFDAVIEKQEIVIDGNQAKINLIIKNNDGTNYNLNNTNYEISLVDNEKFSLNTENTKNVISGNALINENISVDLTVKEGATLNVIENANIKITALSPYHKEIIIPIEIAKLNYYWGYNYTGNYQTFTVPTNGKYKIELWGAQGGPEESSDMLHGGYGAYTSGEIILNKGTELYVYVGDYGYMPDNLQKPFNGGGAPDTKGSWSASYQGNYSGGGATDVRIVSGEWDNFESLKSRIMVAAGGSGGNNIDGTVGGAGGGLLGLTTSDKTLVKVPTQSSGFSFGIGQDSGIYPNTYVAVDGATYTIGADTGAGGGGYYGGYRGYFHNSGGSSGTSFISGHNGCNAISSSSTSTNIVHTGQSVHYSAYQFSNTVMIDGNGYNWTTEIGNYVGMPTHDGASIMVGNTKEGYAKITFIGKN